MDPLSVLSLVEACAGLAVTAGKLAIGLKSLADNYRSAALTFRSLSNQCKLFATAVRAIQAWMEDGNVSNIDDRIWEQLADSLECANDAIYALESELVSTSQGTVNSFWEKVNVVWNVAGLKELQDCIHKQITGLGVILQIMNLPTRQRQTDGLIEQSSVFHESRSSAMSVRDADTSTLRAGGDASSTIRAPSTIMTSLSQMPQFDFEEMLLTSQVYLRNRNKTLAIHAKPSHSGNMQDAGVSVSQWDLPPRFSHPYLNLREAAEILKNGNQEEFVEYFETQWVPKHEELQAKYSKVKRYYFEMDAQVNALREEVEKLRAEDPNNRSQVVSSQTSAAEWSSAAAAAQLKADYEELKLKLETHQQTGPMDSVSGQRVRALEIERQKLKREMEVQQQEKQEMQKQMDWYRIQLSYWNEASNSSGGRSISSGSTAYSAPTPEGTPRR